MQIIKTAEGKQILNMTKSDWLAIGKQAGWFNRKPDPCSCKAPIQKETGRCAKCGVNWLSGSGEPSEYENGLFNPKGQSPIKGNLDSLYPELKT